MKEIALSGYYGFGNAGDEAVLAGLVEALRATAGGAEADLRVNVLSIDPARTRADHGICASHRYAPVDIVRSIASCDLLASGGGSLLQDVTSRHSIFYYLGIVRAAQIMGKRTMFIAQGIGPLTMARSRTLTAAVARRCSAITVRDQDSANLLAQIGVDRPEIVVTADPALLLGADGWRADFAPVGAAVSLRTWRDAPAAFPAMLAQSCIDAIGQQPIASMTMSASDASMHSEFYTALESIRSKPPDIQIDRPAAGWRALSELSAGVEMVIGMRLHALILAAANGVPSVALAYDPKIDAFMQQTGQADAVFDIRDQDAGKLSKLIHRVWEQRVERAIALSAYLPRLRSAAMRNAETALSVATANASR